MRFPVTPIHTDSLVTGVPGSFHSPSAPCAVRGGRPCSERTGGRST